MRSNNFSSRFLMILAVILLLFPLLLVAQNSVNIPVHKWPCDPATGKSGPKPSRECENSSGSKSMRESTVSKYSDKKITVNKNGEVLVCQEAIPLNNKCEPTREPKIEYCDYTGCHTVPSNAETAEKLVAELDKFKEPEVLNKWKIDANTAILTQEAQRQFERLKDSYITAGIIDPQGLIVPISPNEQSTLLGSFERVVRIPMDQIPVVSEGVEDRIRQYVEGKIAAGENIGYPIQGVSIPLQLVSEDFVYLTRDDTGIVTMHTTQQMTLRDSVDPEPYGTPYIPPYNYSDPDLPNPITPPQIYKENGEKGAIPISTFLLQQSQPTEQSNTSFGQRVSSWFQSAASYSSNAWQSLLRALHI